MPLSRDDQEALRVADGAERSRRAAWAMFFQEADRARAAQGRYDHLAATLADAVRGFMLDAVVLAIRVKLHSKIKPNDPAYQEATKLIEEVCTHPHGQRVYDEAMEQLLS